MKVPVTLEFEVEIEVEHIENSVYVRVVQVDSDGGSFHYPKDLDEEDSYLLAEYKKSEVAGLSDQEIVDKATVYIG